MFAVPSRHNKIDCKERFFLIVHLTEAAKGLSISAQQYQILICVLLIHYAHRSWLVIEPR